MAEAVAAERVRIPGWLLKLVQEGSKASILQRGASKVLHRPPDTRYTQGGVMYFRSGAGGGGSRAVCGGGRVGGGGEANKQARGQ